eukprot:GHVT01009734.1.p1 GENE.GHVT01009734.1~~GHVT01009734.1.p1  ORF type:complete len:687 (+),score=111.60 GHVT01009734.1:763-2823(+)
MIQTVSGDALPPRGRPTPLPLPIGVRGTVGKEKSFRTLGRSLISSANPVTVRPSVDNGGSAGAGVSQRSKSALCVEKRPHGSRAELDSAHTNRGGRVTENHKREDRTSAQTSPTGYATSGVSTSASSSSTSPCSISSKLPPDTSGGCSPSSPSRASSSAWASASFSSTSSQFSCAYCSGGIGKYKRYHPYWASLLICEDCRRLPQCSCCERKAVSYASGAPVAARVAQSARHSQPPSVAASSCGFLKRRLNVGGLHLCGKCNSCSPVLTSEHAQRVLKWTLSFLRKKLKVIFTPEVLKNQMSKEVQEALMDYQRFQQLHTFASRPLQNSSGPAPPPLPARTSDEFPIAVEVVDYTELNPSGTTNIYGRCEPRRVKFPRECFSPSSPPPSSSSSSSLSSSSSSSPSCSGVQVVQRIAVVRGLPESLFAAHLAHELLHAFFWLQPLKYPKMDLAVEEGLCNSISAAIIKQFVDLETHHHATTATGSSPTSTTTPDVRLELLKESTVIPCVALSGPEDYHKHSHGVTRRTFKITNNQSIPQKFQMGNCGLASSISASSAFPDFASSVLFSSLRVQEPAASIKEATNRTSKHKTPTSSPPTAKPSRQLSSSSSSITAAELTAAIERNVLMFRLRKMERDTDPCYGAGFRVMRKIVANLGIRQTLKLLSEIPAEANAKYVARAAANIKHNS